MGIQIYNPGGGGGGGGSGDALYDAGLGGAAKAIDWSQGNVQLVTLDTASCQFTFTNWKPKCTLLVKQDITGGRLAVFAGVKWFGGSAPVLTTTAKRVDRLDFVWNGLNALGRYNLNSQDPSGLTFASIPDFAFGLLSWEGVTESSGSVTQWLDQAVGTVVSQSTGSYQPSLVTNQLNGKPIVRFDNADDRLVAATVDLFQPGRAFTLYAVVKFGSVGYNDLCIVKGGLQVMRSSAPTYGDLYVNPNGGPAMNTGTLTWNPGFNKIRVQYNGGDHTDPANYSLKLNGTMATLTPQGNTGTGSASTFVSTHNAPMNGDLALLLWYNRLTSAGEDTTVNTIILEELSL